MQKYFNRNARIFFVKLPQTDHEIILPISRQHSRSFYLGQLTPTIDSWKLALAIDLPTIHAVSSLQD